MSLGGKADGGNENATIMFALWNSVQAALASETRLYTCLRPGAEILDQLRAQTVTGFQLGLFSPSKSWRGSVGSDQFRVSRASSGRNSFILVYAGKLRDLPGGGVEVAVTARLHHWTRGFMCVWLGFLTLIALSFLFAGLLTGVGALFQGRADLMAQGFCLLLFALPCLALIWFGLSLARWGRSVDESEGWSQLERFWQGPVKSESLI